MLADLDQPQHQGGCGDSGRFDKQALAALKRYKPSLKLYNDPQRVKAVLDWVVEMAAARKQGVETKGEAAENAAARELDSLQV